MTLQRRVALRHAERLEERAAVMLEHAAELRRGVIHSLSTANLNLVDISPELSTVLRSQRRPATTTDFGDLERSVGSGERVSDTLGDPETSLTEDELILAHGGLHVVRDD